MSRKVIILSVVTFLFAILTAAFVWVVISVLQRLNPELNFGRQGYEAEVQEEREQCTADQVCLAHPESGEERIVPSSCDGDTPDVATLTDEGYIRCSAILEE